MMSAAYVVSLLKSMRANDARNDPRFELVPVDRHHKRQVGQRTRRVIDIEVACRGLCTGELDRERGLLRTPQIHGAGVEEDGPVADLWRVDCHVTQVVVFAAEPERNKMKTKQPGGILTATSARN